MLVTIQADPKMMGEELYASDHLLFTKLVAQMLYDPMLIFIQ
jgi:hypothetical protein